MDTLPNLESRELYNRNKKPFGNGGDFFMQPYIAEDATKNGYNMISDSYKIYNQTLQAATATNDNFVAISNAVEGTNEIPGPGNFISQMAPVNSQELTGRAADLSLCAQNMSTMASGTGNSSISASLLPNSGMANTQNQTEGFSDCNVQNVLANQTFLSSRSGGVIGTDTVSGSLRNGNLSIRSEPPNPLLYVGPWNLSTIYPDLLRRPLEGCGPSFGLYGNGPLSSGIPVETKLGI